jgi:putrescine transport system substrate-binding protein
MKRLGSALLFFACFVLLTVGGASAQQRIIKIYNWSDYIDPSVLDDFTAATGIKVIYDVYDSNEILETKLLAGNIGYDLVFPSGNFLARQIEAGIFRPLDRSKLPNWKNLDPEIMARLEKYDPGNKFGIPYLWGTTGIAYNVDKIKERMPDASLDSWKMIFEPENLKRFADCGIYMLDAPDEVIPAALKYLGEDPDSKDPAVLAKAEPVLLGIRPYVRKFHSSENINALANGDICLAVMWSGDAKIAGNRAEEAGKNVKIEYRIPKEGAQMWFDMMAIPKSAANAEDAFAFINYLLEPEVIAKSTNVVTYANPNSASKPFIDQSILNDPTIYPPPDVMNKLFLVTPNDQKTQRVVTRIWQRVKTGR